MYLPSDEQCNGMLNSQDPAASAQLAADAQAANAVFDSSVMGANSTWLGLLSRPWQSYAQFGPFVAYQLRNGQPEINQQSVAAGIVISDSVETQPQPINGVTLVAQGNVDGSNPVAGGSGTTPAPDPQRRRRTKDLADDAQWIATFGTTPDIQTYTGPLPKQGSPLSLVVGGSNRASLIGPGTYPAGTPDPRYGYCPGGAVPGLFSAMNGNGGGSPVSGVGFSILALVALAGLGYWANQQDKKRGRVAA